MQGRVAQSDYPGHQERQAPALPWYKDFDIVWFFPLASVNAATPVPHCVIYSVPVDVSELIGALPLALWLNWGFRPALLELRLCSADLGGSDPRRPRGKPTIAGRLHAPSLPPHPPTYMCSRYLCGWPPIHTHHVTGSPPPPPPPPARSLHAINQVPGVLGDNDPLDVVEIGSATIAMGEVVAVKPLGIFSMLDDGELDWKMVRIDEPRARGLIHRVMAMWSWFVRVLSLTRWRSWFVCWLIPIRTCPPPPQVVIRTDDPAAAELNDIRDVDDSVISGIREWFRWYKTPDGKPVNRFGHGERALGRAEALEVVAETHAAWKMLYAGESDAPTNKDIWTKSA